MSNDYWLEDKWGAQEMDQREMVDVVFLDIAKAFDKVPHQRLLLKVASLGFCSKLFDWISSWLLNHTQRVCINGIVSLLFY